MRLEIDMPEHQYNNIMAIDSMSLGRAPYKGIIMYAINAIKHGRVLKQEPTTKNNLGVDCIDRAELLKAMDTWDKFGYSARYGLKRLDKDDKGYVPYVYYDDMVNCVKGLPSVIPYMPSVTPQEPKTGHWILTDVEGFRVWHCNCSKCNKDPLDFVGGSENWWLIKSKLPKFCPHCGSDMREVEE